jgi:serine protease Do
MHRWTFTNVTWTNVTRRGRWISVAVLLLALAALFGMTLSAELRAGYLGMRLNNIDADRAGALKLGEARGVEVVAVLKNGPADRGGIKAGDVLLAYNGEDILSTDQIRRLVGETPEGRKVKVQYWRAGKAATVVLTTGAMPAEPSGVDPSSLYGPIPDIPIAMMVWKNPVLGLIYEPLDAQLGSFFGAKYGVLVRDVLSGSAAENAGLRAGDVITTLGPQIVSSPRDFVSYMRMQYQPGETLTIVILRDKRDVKLRIVFPGDRQ